MAWVCRACGAEHTDAIDQAAMRSGRLTFAEAARRLNRSVWWIKERIKDHEIGLVSHGGRDYASEQDVTLMVNRGLGLSAVESELEQLDALARAGNGEAGRKALYMREAMQDEANGRDAVRYGHVPSYRPPEAGAGDPGLEYARKFSKGGR